MKKLFQLIIITVPILLLMLLSGYYTYNMWDSYNKNNIFKVQLRNTKILQSLEKSVLNEIVCVATMSADKKLISKICNPMKETTNTILNQILEQKDDTSLYGLQNIIINIRKSINDSGNITVEQLVNGDFDKKMNIFIQKNIDILNNQHIDSKNKDKLELYTDVSKVLYASEFEKALVSYYLALKKPIPSKNLVYWDNIVSKTEISENLNNKINILNDESFQKTLRDIEDKRLDIMTNSTRGTYASNLVEWVSLFNKNQNVLESVQTNLLNSISDELKIVSKTSTIKLVVALSTLLISFFALISFFLYWKRNNAKVKELNSLLGKISEVSLDDKLSVNDDLNSHKVAYNYIAAQYETLYDKENRRELENKNYTAFINNLSYEIQTPLNAVSGYTKLLKETNLNSEQNAYLLSLNNSFTTLDLALSKINKISMDEEQKLIIEHKSFNLLNTVESSVESLSIKADQKDIVLGLNTDLAIVCEIKSDEIKLSHIIGTLIDNAIDVSNAYDSVNISVQKVNEDNTYLSIQFKIQDQGIGYNNVELQQIRRSFEMNIPTENIQHVNMKNLSITYKIIKRMGGTLEIESEKGKGSIFKFTLKLEKDKGATYEVSLPKLGALNIGLALPSLDIQREIDYNLKKYVTSMDANFEIYDYETLFNENSSVNLPDVLFVYHGYARLNEELDKFKMLSTKIVLLTSASLRSTVDLEKYTFNKIIYLPITMSKIINFFENFDINILKNVDENIFKENISVTKEVENFNANIIPTMSVEGTFENIKALIIENNDMDRGLISDLLNGYNVSFVFVKDEQEVVILRDKDEFDILFIYFGTSKLDVFEMTSQILYNERIKHLRHIPIIGLVNNMSDDIKVECVQSGMDDCVDTSINENDMYNIIQKYCIELPKEIAQTEEDELIAKVLAGDFLKE